MKRWFLWLALIRRGNALAEPSKWRRRQVTVSALVGLMYAAIRVAESYGITVPVDDQTLNDLAVGVLAIVSLWFGVASDPDVGLSGRDKQHLQDLGDKAHHPVNTD